MSPIFLFDFCARMLECWRILTIFAQLALLSLSINKFLCTSIVCFTWTVGSAKQDSNGTILAATLSNIRRYKLSFLRKIIMVLVQQSLLYHCSIARCKQPKNLKYMLLRCHLLHFEIKVNRNKVPKIITGSCLDVKG